MMGFIGIRVLRTDNIGGIGWGRGGGGVPSAVFNKNGVYS